jgi:16S rRNA (uracil1498-N3)-methyltransferase
LKKTGRTYKKELMSPPRFLLEAPLAAPGLYRLGRDESHHAVNVLRLRAGDGVIVFDGQGRRAEAAVSEANKNSLAVLVDAVTEEPRPPLALTLATAIPKGKRWQGLIEKCTELGVDRVLPLHTERSVAKGEGDAEKWRRWIIEAAKQSRRWWLPAVVEPVPFARVFALAREQGALLFVADARGESPYARRDELRAAKSVIVVVGPEGGLTDDELSECARQGAKAIRLSPFVLRVETAAAAACAILREAAQQS